LYGLAWGMLFSAHGRDVLSMILLAVAGQLAASLFIALLAFLLAGLISVFTGIPADFGQPFFYTCLAVLTIPVVFIGSAAVFTRLDRGRLQPVSMAAGKRPLLHSWSVLFWLTWRQARGFAAGMCVFALFLGFLVLIDGLILWPIMTLLVGVLCGATAFADEQQGPFRFLGDQRLPLGKVWVVKVGVRFAISIVAALLVLVPSFLVALGNMSQRGGQIDDGQMVFHFWRRLFQSDLVGICSPELFLTMWLIHGFCAGCLCGVLLRSGLASGVLGLFVGSVLAAVWAPSLLQGGLQDWQVLTASLLLLLSTLPLLRPWAAGRIASRTTVFRLAPFVILALLAIAGGIWYRVLEVPDVDSKGDLDAFRASLPKPEENKAGELVRSACLRFEEVTRGLWLAEPHQGGGAAMGMAPGQLAAAPMAPPKPPPSERAADTLERGWPADDPELAAWLDKLFAADWVQNLKEAADLPLGMVEDLRNENAASRNPVAGPAREIAVVLVARGLQRQAAGDDGAYVENLRIGLHLARAMRYHAPALNVLVSRNIEGTLVRGLDRWLEKLNGRPDLLHKALDLLSDYQDRTPEDGADQTLVDYLKSRNSLDDPSVLVMEMLSEQGGRSQDNERLRTEAQWINMAGLVPWERERRERQLRVFFYGTKDQRSSPGVRQSLVNLFTYSSALSPNFSPKPDFQCRERAGRLILALRLDQAKNNGKPADTLDELVPKYLPTIPLDAYDDNPFRYRLSRGEEIEWPEDPQPPGAQPPAPAAAGGMPAPFAPPGPLPPPHTRKIPPGQGVLWSIGADKRDDGGHRQIGASVGLISGEDLIFLVPLPAKAK
jgi:hypothetical protein